MCFRKWIFYHTSVSRFIQSPCLIYWCTRYDTLSFCCSAGTTSTSAIFTLHEVVWPAIDITMATRKYFHPNNLFFLLIFGIFSPPFLICCYYLRPHRQPPTQAGTCFLFPGLCKLDATLTKQTLTEWNVHMWSPTIFFFGRDGGGAGGGGGGVKCVNPLSEWIWSQAAVKQGAGQLHNTDISYVSPTDAKYRRQLRRNQSFCLKYVGK